MKPEELRRAALLKARKARLEPTPTRIKQVAVGQQNRDRLPGSHRKDSKS